MTIVQERWYWQPRVTRTLIVGVYASCLIAGTCIGYIEDQQPGWIWGAFVGAEVGLFLFACFPRPFFRATSPAAAGTAAVAARLGRVEMLRHRERFTIRSTARPDGPDEHQVRLPLSEATLWWGSYVPFLIPLGLAVVLVGLLPFVMWFAAFDVVFRILLVAYPVRVVWGLLIALRIAGGTHVTAMGLFAGKRMLVDARAVVSCEARSNEVVVMLKGGARAPVGVLDEMASKTMASILREAWNLETRSEENSTGTGPRGDA